MKKKIREEILGDKADEIREEIWQKERYAEREGLNLAKNEKVKEKLIEQVKDKGQFYRIRTFVDLISNPMLDNIDILLKQRKKKEEE